MSRKRRVTFNQLESLWAILNVNKALATGYNKSSQAREYSKRMWLIAADTLNSQGDGAEKSWKGWCKYWNDYKSKIKTKAASARASLHRTGGGPSNEGRLSDIELKFLQILGEDFWAGLPGVRVEPSFNIPTGDQTEAGSAPLLSAHSEQSESVLAHHLNMESVLDMLVIPPEPTAAKSTPPAPALASTLPPPPARTPPPPPARTPPPPPARTPPPPPARTPPPPSAPAAAPHVSFTPRRTPRRRQRQRRLVPMSAATARQSLVNMSEERVRLEERRNAILENIALELREIKGILNTRLPGLPTADEQA